MRLHINTQKNIRREEKKKIYAWMLCILYSNVTPISDWMQSTFYIGNYLNIACLNQHSIMVGYVLNFQCVNET